MDTSGKSRFGKNNKVMPAAFSPAPGQVKQFCFTLIELLVVIAIIAILAAILLPALQKARERGMTSNCTSRIKQFGMINMSYCNDYDGYTPKYWGGSYPWMALKDYPPVNTYKLKATILGNDEPQKVPVFCCPKYFRHPKTATSKGTVYYGWINFEFWKRSHTNIKRVKKPSKKFMHTELALLTRYNEFNANYYRTTYNSFLHNKMMNVFHHDGHVEMFREIRPWFSTAKINKSPGFADYWDYEY